MVTSAKEISDLAHGVDVHSSGNVGIGTNTPEYPLQVSGSNVTSGGGQATLGIFDTGTAYNGTNPGGGITFRGKYNNAGSLTNFATVQGVKENTTDGNYASALRFTTRANGGNLTERMKIDSSGNVGIGITPTDYLTAGYNLRLYGGTQTYLAFNNSTHTTQVLGGFVIGNDGGAARITQRENQPIIFATNDTTAITIDASQKVGIGTTPNFTFHSVGTARLQGSMNNTHGQLSIYGTSAGDAQIAFVTDANGRGIYVDNNDTNKMKFYTGYGPGVAGREITMDNTGSMYIGKTSYTVASAGVILDQNGTTYYTKSTGNTLHLHDTANYKFYVNANGGIYNYQSNNVNLSDEREKKNIENMSSQWETLKKWKLKRFHFNKDEDSDDKKYGVIAQDVESHNPEVVTDFKSTDEETRLAVKEQQMTWIAIKALQEAMEKIETLEARITALESA